MCSPDDGAPVAEEEQGGAVEQRRESGLPMQSATSVSRMAQGAAGLTCRTPSCGWCCASCSAGMRRNIPQSLDGSGSAHARHPPQGWARSGLAGPERYIKHRIGRPHLLGLPHGLGSCATVETV